MYLYFLKTFLQILYFFYVILTLIQLSVLDTWLSLHYIKLYFYIINTLIIIILKNNFIFTLFSFLILSQIIGTVSNPQNHIKNLYYIISEINIMFISLIFFKMYNKKFLKIYFNSNLIIFFLLFLYFFFIYIKYYFIFDNNFYSTWGNIINNESVPRPTGMARLAMIFSSYFFCIYTLNNKKYLLFLIFFNYVIFAFQSRVVILALLFITLIFILIKERYSTVKTLKYLILIFIIPFIISLVIDFSKREILFNNTLTNNTLTNNTLTNNTLTKKSIDIRIFNSEIISKNFTSNRKQD